VRRRAIRASGRLSEHVLLPLRHLQEDLGRRGYGERGRADGVDSAAGRGDLVRTYQPDEGSAKTFCSVCGSNLFGSGWPLAEVTSVRLSAIDTPFDERPEGHIYVRSLAPWETLPDDGLERFEAGQSRN